MLNGGRLDVAGRPEVDREDGEAVGELLDVLAGGIEVVVVVEVGEGGEEALGAAALVDDDDTLLVGLLVVDDLDDGAVAVGGLLHHGPVEVLGVLGGALEEDLVADEGEVEAALGRGGVGELALVDKVAAELGGGVGGDGA